MSPLKSKNYMSVAPGILLISFFVSGQTVRQRPQTLPLKFDRSKEISAEALQSSQTGDLRKAIEIASAGLHDCSADEMGSACRVLLNYTIGYVYQQAAQIATTPTERERALSSAAASYRAELSARSRGPTAE